MVLCLIGLVVFSIMGIFSAKYRKLAKESLDCTLNMAVLRPCQTGLDEKMKYSIVAFLLPKSPKLAKIINKRFQIFSILMVLLFFGSLIYTGISVYNYFEYGNCNGPNSTGFCVFNVISNRQIKTPNSSSNISISTNLQTNRSYSTITTNS